MGKQVADILKYLDNYKTTGNKHREIKGIAFDSRRVERDYVFVAIKGTITDGHKYISQAISKGAGTIVCEHLPDSKDAGTLYIEVPNSSLALGLISRAYYDDPSSRLLLTGVTGTNGKTTVATLLYRFYRLMGIRTGLISTIENRINDDIIPSSHTTPDIININVMLKRMVDAGCRYCFMEVSSHAIVQNRISGLCYHGGIFTNITHEHLDYHPSFKDYLLTKKSFFDNLPREAFALTNIDDKNGQMMMQNCNANIHTYGIKKIADYKAKILVTRIDSTQLLINGKDLWVRLPGLFNAYNLLAVYATTLIMGTDKDEALVNLSKLESAEGRFEIIQGPEKKVGIIDYAHTPDALLNVLQTISTIRSKKQKVITVVGAGGDRDRSKRPVMGKIASDYSDRVILTSDNPRSENPQAIINDMIDGIPVDRMDKVISIPDRGEAIKAACTMLSQNDIILIAGKGHEKYQVVGEEMLPFDDKQVLKDLWK